MEPPDCGKQLRELADGFERKWLSKVPPTHRWKWRAARLLRPALSHWRVRREVKLRGAAVQRVAGASSAEQYRWALDAERRLFLRADYFYRLRLYEPVRQAHMDEFLSNQQCCHLLGGLLDIRPTTNVPIHADKRVFAHHCAAHGLPSPQTVWDSENADSPRLSDLDLFAKQVGNTSAGAGAHHWRCCGPNRYRDSAGRELDGHGVVAHIRGLSDRDHKWLLQPALTNHASLAGITNGALATFRIVTSMVGRHGVEWVGAVLRLPAGTSAVDNYCQGNLVVSVDASSGQLNSPGFRAHGLLGAERMDSHPDTGEHLEGRTIAEWTALRELVSRAHGTCPDLPFVGWDVALCPEGPVLIEANLGWGAQLMQVPAPRGICGTIFGPRYLEAHREATGRTQSS